MILENGQALAHNLNGKLLTSLLRDHDNPVFESLLDRRDIVQVSNLLGEVCVWWSRPQTHENNWSAGQSPSWVKSISSISTTPPSIDTIWMYSVLFLISKVRVFWNSSTKRCVESFSILFEKKILAKKCLCRRGEFTCVVHVPSSTGACWKGIRENRIRNTTLPCKN